MGGKTQEKSSAATVGEDREEVRIFAEDVAPWRDENESATTVAATRPLRALIVEDNTDLAYMMSELIQQCGHEVQTVGDGPTALKMFVAFCPDVAFVDIAMPQMDGFCVARQLRGSGQFDDCLLVAVTGYADAAHHAMGMQAGFDHYLVKPVAFRTLAELLVLARNRLVKSDGVRNKARELTVASC